MMINVRVTWVQVLTRYLFMYDLMIMYCIVLGLTIYLLKAFFKEMKKKDECFTHISPLVPSSVQQHSWIY